ncbi:hypothetical protein FOMA001_g4936 [Fusarium oxysporum f. sp. matthiolae]|nr:hypothetical protein FOMA001_g4936 [Fusarium oxysporum f. sp. matthiolae]
MSGASPLLHILDTKQGNGFILDFYIDGQRRFILLDRGESYAPPFGREFGAYGLFHMQLISAARAIWSRASTSGDMNSTPFNPTAIICLQSHESYQVLLALLHSYGASDPVGTASEFQGPFVLPNPVNIQDGWKVVPPVRGRYEGITEILRATKFEITDRMHLTEILQGLHFAFPKMEKMLCFGRTTGTHSNPDIGNEKEAILPTPNSQSILLSTIKESGGNILLAMNTSDFRISSAFLEDKDPHFSIYQIQGDHHRFNRAPEIHVSVAREFALWVLMELGYHELGFTKAQESELSPLTEKDLLHPALTWTISTLWPAEGRSGIATWSYGDKMAPGSDWVCKLELSQSRGGQIPQAFVYLASVLSQVLGSHDSFKYLKALRSRQTQYLSQCKGAPDKEVNPLKNSTESELHLHMTPEELLESMTERLKALCLKDRSFDIDSAPIRLGVFGIEVSNTGSFKGYPEFWTYWMDAKHGGRVSEWSQLYYALISISSAQRFHSLFSSNGYFLSPQGSRDTDNTRPYECLGLAMAIADSSPHRQTSLFLHSTQLLDWEAMNQLAKLFGTNIRSLFGSGKFPIQRSRVYGMYATFNGSDPIQTMGNIPSYMDTVPDWASVDTGDKGSEYFLADLAEKQIKDSPPVAGLANRGDQMFQVFCTGSSTQTKLYLESDFELFPTPPVLDPKGPYPPPFKLTAKSPRYGLRVLDAPGHDANSWHLAIFGADARRRESPLPYKAITTPTSEGYHCLRFEYPEDSGRYFAFYNGPGSKDYSLLVLKSEKDLSESKLKEATFKIEKANGKEEMMSPLVSGESIPLERFILRGEKVDLSKLSLPFILGLVLERSTSNVKALLEKRLPISLINSGFIDALKVDFTRSSVIAVGSVLGTNVASNIVIFGSRPPTAPTFDLITGVKCDTQDVQISIDDIRMPSCKVSVKLGAVLASSSGNKWPLSASTSFTLNQDTRSLPWWTLRFTAMPSLSQLSSALDAPLLCNRELELMKKAPPFFKSPLCDIVSGEVKGIELSCQQVDFGFPSSILSAVTLDTELNEWEGFLPESFVGEGIQVYKGSVKLKVENPMFEDLLRLNVAVDFDFNMKVPKPLTIPFTLTATQLFSSDEFEYRVSTRMPLASPSENNEQINAADVLRFISDTATWRTVKEDIPIAYENLSKGKVQALSIRLKGLSPRYIAEDFEIKFSCDAIPLSEGLSDVKLELSSAEMNIQTFCGVAKCEGNGIIWVRDYAIPSFVKLPQKTIPGMSGTAIKNTNISGFQTNFRLLLGFVTIQNIWGTSFTSLLGIPHFTGIPLLKGISTSFEAQIQTLQFQLFNRTEDYPAMVDVSSVNFKFEPHERLSIQNLPTMQAVQGSFDLGDRNKTSTSLNMKFYVCGETENHQFSVTIKAQEQSKTVVVSFYPTEDISVSAMLATVIELVQPPSTFAKHLVTSATFTFEFSPEGLLPKHCEIDLVSKTPLAIGGATVSRLLFETDIEATKGSRKSQKLINTCFSWRDSVMDSLSEFQITPSTESDKIWTLSLKCSATGQATAYQILDKFGIVHPTSIDEPEGISKDEFLRLPVSELKGALVAGPNGFEIQRMELTIKTSQQKSLTLLQSRNIVVQSVGLQMSYQISSPSPSVAFIGLVKLTSSLDIPVKFSRTDDGPRWDGEFNIGSRSTSTKVPTNLNLDEVAAKILPNSEAISIPRSSGLPKTLPVVSGEASFVQGKSVSLSATINAAKWELKIGDLLVVFSGLAGHLATFDGEKKTWRAAVTAKTSFGPFVAAQGALQLCATKKPVLAARLSKPTENPSGQTKDDFTALVNKMSSESPDWSEIRPKDAPALSFNPSAALYYSFNTSTVLLTGSIAEVGGVSILVQNNGSKSEKNKTDFLVTIGLSNPSVLWKKLAADVSQHFNFQSVTAFFSSTLWKQEDLKHIIEDAMTASDEFNGVLAQSDSLNPNDTGLTTASAFVSGRDGPVEAGAQFEAVVSLDGDKDLVNSLNELAEPGTKPLVVLSAKVQGDKFDIGISITKFTFASGAITLNNCSGRFGVSKGTAKGVEGSPELDLSARLDFHIPDTEAIVGLAAQINLTKQKCVFKVSLKNENDKEIMINNPFGQSFGLKFTMLEFDGAIYFKGSKSSQPSPVQKSSFNLEGKVDIGSYTFDAQLLFYAGKPKVLSISFGQTLKVEEVVTDIINNSEEPAKAKAWPSESYPPIEFSNGHIYYSFLGEKDAPLVDPREVDQLYYPGFNIQSTMAVFSRKALVRVYIFPERSGFIITGSLEKPIDLGWLKMYRRDPKPNKEVVQGGGKQVDDFTKDGPDVLYVWNNRTDDPHGVGQTRFELNSHASIFELPPFTCTIGYAAADKTFNGYQKFDKTANQVGDDGSSIRIIYHNDRFWVNGMNLSRIWDDLDLAKAIRDFSEQKDPKNCGKLVDLVFDQVLKYKCSFGLSLSSTEGDKAPGIEATITVKFRVMLGDTGQALDEISLPDWTGRLIFNVPNAEALFNWLHELVKDYLTHVADFILEHPLEFAKLMAWMNAKQYGKQLVKTLMCRDVQPENIKKRHFELFPEEYTVPVPPQPPVDKCVCEGDFWERFLCNMGRNYWHGR